VLAPTIAVVVQPYTPNERDTECVNGPGGPSAGDQIETFVAVDVPAWVKSHFRARTDRGSWAVWGPSAGAWCAAVTAMLHPDTFSAFMAFGPYFKVEWGNWQPYQPGDPALARYDLTALASQHPPSIAAWIYVSRQDSQSWPETVPFLAAAKPPLAVTTRIVATGGHRTTLWTPWVPVMLTWLAQTAPGFAANPISASAQPTPAVSTSAGAGVGSGSGSGGAVTGVAAGTSPRPSRSAIRASRRAHPPVRRPALHQHHA
jgi:hypothetical protein